MRTVLLFMVALLFINGVVLAQSGSIGIYGDNLGTSCYLSDNANEIAHYYVVQFGTTGASGVEFAAPKPSCLVMGWMSETRVFPNTIGIYLTGVTILYGSGACLSAPVHVLTILVYTMGETSACCLYPIVAHPVNGGPWILDCAGVKHLAVANKGIINGNASCTCDAVPAEDTTWGRVKALYTD